jgi:F0F1-type ATP synthase alpha subunit
MSPAYSFSVVSFKKKMICDGFFNRENILDKVLQRFLTTSLHTPLRYTGKVISIGDGIATVFGLGNVRAGELVRFLPSNIQGLALNLEKTIVKVVVFGNDRNILQGDFVERTNSIVSVPVGELVLGRVVDALGTPIDGLGSIKGNNA